MRHVIRGPALLGVLTVLLAMVPGFAAEAEAQQYPQERDGFWVSVGAGYGSLGWEHDSDREDGLSGNLTLGGVVSERVLLGAGTTGWTKEVEGLRVTFGTLALMTRIYPSYDSGLFVNLGLGVGRASLSEGSTSISESGAGAILGIGYDVRLGPTWSLSPYANAIGFSIDDDRWDVFQFGLGVTWH